jgi:formyl-CoA transferase
MEHAAYGEGYEIMNQGTVQSGILKGYTVLELSTLISGPYCASLLGDMGADVIKVELPGTGDGLRDLGLSVEEESALFLAVNRNKKSVTLALKKPEGRAILDRIISQADVIVENFRPDIREQYGLDYERVRKIRPDIVYLSITAFGEEGPYRLKPGTDHVFQGLSGIMSVSGKPGEGPVRMGVPIADMTASLFGALGVTSALLHRERTGEGQLLCVNLLDAAMCLQGAHITEYLLTGKEPVPCGNDSPFAYPVGVFRTMDGYIAISAFNHKFWRSLCSALDLEFLAEDARFDTMEKRFSNRDELRPSLDERFATKTTAQWLVLLEDKDVPCGPVHNYDTLFKDPQVQENRLVRDLCHSRIKTVPTVGNPLHFSETPVGDGAAAPVLGEHNDSVLSLLGFSEEEIADLRQRKII